MLPTFVGAALERGRIRLPVTAAIFVAGIAVLMLPIVLGGGLLGDLVAANHCEVFFGVGLFLALLAIQVLSARPWVAAYADAPAARLGLQCRWHLAPGVTSGFAS